MTTTAVATTTRTHMSLNVADLGKSVAFYTTLFGTGPAKRYDDYAKFELDDPPVVLSLQPGPRPAGASLSHVGLRVPTAEAILEVQHRLEAAGYPIQRQDGIVCGYARQSKCWAADPDHNYWEIYVLEADVDPRQVRACLADLVPATTAAVSEPASSWEHRLTEPVPERLAQAEASLDEVRLVGTWNADLSAARRQQFYGEILRVLRPGGKVLLHGLAADRPFSGGLQHLPAPAMVVERVPVEAEPARELAQAGFIHVQMTKVSAAPCLTLGEVEFRELKLAATKPPEAGTGPGHVVLYKGPLASVTDSLGNVYPRGRRVIVSHAAWERLRRGPAAAQFLFVTPGQQPACSSGH
jgi:catechol 2,3-dioxygenase-like lactoylglutathione lyase family enzyme